MSRNTLLGIGTVLLLLLAGGLLWRQQPNDGAARSADTIKIVRTAQHEEVQQANKAVASGTAGTNALPTSQDDTGRIPEDAEIQASLPSSDFDPLTLYKRIRSEGRDSQWAGRSEATMKEALNKVPYIDRERGVRVSCASTLCEVRGSVAADASRENANVALQALQGQAFGKSLAAGDLEVTTASFGGGGKAANFTIYTKRR